MGICNPQQSVPAHLLLGDYKSPGFIGRTFFYGGFQIRRDAIFAINNVALKKQKQSMKDALPFRATWRF